MSWYNHIGLNKDKVSELLKRYQLFMILPEKKEWIASLSNQAVKILTGANVQVQQLQEACFLEIKSVDEIKYWLTSSNLIYPKNAPEVPQVIEAIDDDIITEFKELRHKIKTLKNSDNLKQYKSQLKSVRRELEELEAIIQEQEDNQVHKDNLNLFTNNSDSSVAVPADEDPRTTIEKVNVQIGDKFFYLKDSIILEIEIIDIESGEYIETNIPLPNEPFPHSRRLNLTELLNEEIIQSYDELDSVIELYKKNYGTSLEYASEENIKEYVMQNRAGNYLRIDNN